MATTATKITERITELISEFDPQEKYEVYLTYDSRSDNLNYPMQASFMYMQLDDMPFRQEFNINFFRNANRPLVDPDNHKTLLWGSYSLEEFFTFYNAGSLRDRDGIHTVLPALAYVPADAIGNYLPGNYILTSLHNQD